MNDIWFACGICGGDVCSKGGDEWSGADYGGQWKARDEFDCLGCGREYYRVEKERFPSDAGATGMEVVRWWGVRMPGGEWDFLDEPSWPRRK